MDAVHELHRYGQYSYSDIMEMTNREMEALMERTNHSIKLENEAIDKAVKG